MLNKHANCEHIWIAERTHDNSPECLKSTGLSMPSIGELAKRMGPHWENSLHASYNIKRTPSSGPAVLCLGTYPRDVEIHVWMVTTTWFITACSGRHPMSSQSTMDRTLGGFSQQNSIQQQKHVSADNTTEGALQKHRAE